MGKESEASQENLKFLEETKAMVEQISDFKKKAEHSAQEAEASRVKSDSEALFASNAKKACEEHSTTIAGLKGNIEADIQNIASNRQKSDEALTGISTAKSNAEGDAKIIADFRRESEKLSTEFADWSVKAQGSAATAEESLKQFEEARIRIQQNDTDTGKAREQAVQTMTKIEESAMKVDAATQEATAKHAAIVVTSGDVDRLFKSVESAEGSVKQIVDRLVKSDAAIAQYDVRLKDILARSEMLTIQAESLLPGVTTAGLASAFSLQRARFAQPQRRWLYTFVVCIVTLVIISLPSFFSAFWVTSPLSWDTLIRGLVVRLPVAIPLVWLAIYAGRHYMIAVRVEEDYAYKETVSRAFEGFRREMENISAKRDSDVSPLTILCTNILSAIAERPGRIYETQSPDITPMSEAQGVAEQVKNIAAAKVSA